MIAMPTRPRKTPPRSTRSGAAVGSTRLLAAVELVDQCFRRFVSNKRELKTGPRGQVIGCEAYRLDFTGFQEAEVNDALIMLWQAANNQGEPQPPTTGMADRKDV